VENDFCNKIGTKLPKPNLAYCPQLAHRVGGQAVEPTVAIGGAADVPHLEPRYRGLAYTVRPREIGLCGAFREPLHGFPALMGGQYRGRPTAYAKTSLKMLRKSAMNSMLADL
jgi:hypothetical protein